MNTTVIFDFDGTIADSFFVIKNILLSLSDDFGYKKLPDSEIDLLRKKHPREIIKLLGIPYYKIPFMIHRLNSEIQKQIAYIKPVKGIKEALLKLKEEKYSLGILSSASEKNVSAFLKNNDIEVFSFIHTGIGIFGKAQVLNQVLKKQKINKNEAIYVGDEIRDIEAAKKVGIKIISVAWGFNEKSSLKEYHPNILIDNPNKLLNAVTAVSDVI